LLLLLFFGNLNDAENLFLRLREDTELDTARAPQILSALLIQYRTGE
jgi:hypothetical protein